MHPGVAGADDDDGYACVHDDPGPLFVCSISVNRVAARGTARRRRCPRRPLDFNARRRGCTNYSPPGAALSPTNVRRNAR